MARTVSSFIVDPSATKAAKNDPQDDVIAAIFGSLADLWRLGPEYRDLTAKRATLKAQLEDQMLRDHPKRPVAMERYVKWAVELKSIEKRAAVAKIVFCAQFEALSERNRQTLLAGEGWPQSDDVEVLANELWTMAQAWDPLPFGETPF